MEDKGGREQSIFAIPSGLPPLFSLLLKVKAKKFI